MKATLSVSAWGGKETAPHEPLLQKLFPVGTRVKLEFPSRRRNATCKFYGVTIDGYRILLREGEYEALAQAEEGK